jgi:glucuronate isomerase
MTIKFFKKSIKKDNIKVKVNYSYSRPDETIDGLERITIYETDWSHNLAKIFKDTINNSDTLTDYHEAMRVKILPNNPLFNKLKAFC